MFSFQSNQPIPNRNIYYDLSKTTTWPSVYTFSTIETMNNNPSVRPSKFINYNTKYVKQNKKDIIYLNAFKYRDKPIEGYMIFKYGYDKLIPLKGDEVISSERSIHVGRSSFNNKSFIEDCCEIYLNEYDILNEYCYSLFSRDLDYIIDNYKRDRVYYNSKISARSSKYLMYKVLVYPNDIFSVSYGKDLCGRNKNIILLYSKRVIINSDILKFKELLKKYI